MEEYFKEKAADAIITDGKYKGVSSGQNHFTF
jgi:hypothetical protein